MYGEGKQRGVYHTDKQTCMIWFSKKPSQFQSSLCPSEFLSCLWLCSNVPIHVSRYTLITVRIMTGTLSFARPTVMARGFCLTAKTLSKFTWCRIYTEILEGCKRVNKKELFTLSSSVWRDQSLFLVWVTDYQPTLLAFSSLSPWSGRAFLFVPGHFEGGTCWICCISNWSSSCLEAYCNLTLFHSQAESRLSC